MTRDDIIRMAREQGLPETATEGVFIVNADDLGRMLRRYALCDNQPVQRFVGRRNTQERETAMQDALMKKKYDDLRAKIEAMERQEPVATVRINAINGNPSVDFVPGHHYLHHNDRLYLAPGAQPAPSVPEGWKLVPTAESRHPGIYKMLGALHAIDNTRGASEWESYAAMLAAAPEAKP